MARPVKPLRTCAKAKAKAKAQVKGAASSQGVKRKAATAFGKAWFENGQVAKASKLDVGVSKERASAQILVVDDYDKDLNSSSISLHCHFHGKTLASKNTKIEGGKLIGKYTSFRKPSDKILLCASSAVIKKHSTLMKELEHAPCVTVVQKEEAMLKACQNLAFSQVRWLGVKAEVLSFAQRLQGTKVSSSRALACTASHFVEHVGAVIQAKG